MNYLEFFNYIKGLTNSPAFENYEESKLLVEQIKDFLDSHAQSEMLLSINNDEVLRKRIVTTSSKLYSEIKPPESKGITKKIITKIVADHVEKIINPHRLEGEFDYWSLEKWNKIIRLAKRIQKVEEQSSKEFTINRSDSQQLLPYYKDELKTFEELAKIKAEISKYKENDEKLSKLAAELNRSVPKSPRLYNLNRQEKRIEKKLNLKDADLDFVNNSIAKQKKIIKKIKKGSGEEEITLPFLNREPKESQQVFLKLRQSSLESLQKLEKELGKIKPNCYDFYSIDKLRVTLSPDQFISTLKRLAEIFSEDLNQQDLKIPLNSEAKKSIITYINFNNHLKDIADEFDVSEIEASLAANHDQLLLETILADSERVRYFNQDPISLESNDLTHQDHQFIHLFEKSLNQDIPLHERIELARMVESNLENKRLQEYNQEKYQDIIQVINQLISIISARQLTSILEKVDRVQQEIENPELDNQNNLIIGKENKLSNFEWQQLKELSDLKPLLVNLAERGVIKYSSKLKKLHEQATSAATFVGKIQAKIDMESPFERGDLLNKLLTQKDNKKLIKSPGLTCAKKLFDLANDMSDEMEFRFQAIKALKIYAEEENLDINFKNLTFYEFLGTNLDLVYRQIQRNQNRIIPKPIIDFFKKLAAFFGFKEETKQILERTVAELEQGYINALQEEYNSGKVPTNYINALLKKQENQGNSDQELMISSFNTLFSKLIEKIDLNDPQLFDNLSRLFQNRIPAVIENNEDPIASLIANDKDMKNSAIIIYELMRKNSEKLGRNFIEMAEAIGWPNEENIEEYIAFTIHYFMEYFISPMVDNFELNRDQYEIIPHFYYELMNKLMGGFIAQKFHFVNDYLYDEHRIEQAKTLKSRLFAGLHLAIPNEKSIGKFFIRSTKEIFADLLSFVFFSQSPDRLKIDMILKDMCFDETKARAYIDEAKAQVHFDESGESSIKTEDLFEEIDECMDLIAKADEKPNLLIPVDKIEVIQAENITTEDKIMPSEVKFTKALVEFRNLFFTLQNNAQNFLIAMNLQEFAEDTVTADKLIANEEKMRGNITEIEKERFKGEAGNLNRFLTQVRAYNLQSVIDNNIMEDFKKLAEIDIFSQIDAIIPKGDPTGLQQSEEDEIINQLCNVLGYEFDNNYLRPLSSLVTKTNSLLAIDAKIKALSKDPEANLTYLPYLQTAIINLAQTLMKTVQVLKEVQNFYNYSNTNSQLEELIKDFDSKSKNANAKIQELVTDKISNIFGKVKNPTTSGDALNEFLHFVETTDWDEKDGKKIQFEKEIKVRIRKENDSNKTNSTNKFKKVTVTVEKKIPTPIYEMYQLVKKAKPTMAEDLFLKKMTKIADKAREPSRFSFFKSEKQYTTITQDALDAIVRQKPESL